MEPLLGRAEWQDDALCVSGSGAAAFSVRLRRPLPLLRLSVRPGRGSASIDVHFANGSRSLGNALLDNQTRRNDQSSEYVRVWHVPRDAERAVLSLVAGPSDAPVCFGEPALRLLPIEHELRERAEALLPATAVGCCPQREWLRAARRDEVDRARELSIVTHLTRDRLPSLRRLVHQWRGPVSAAFLALRDADVAALRDALENDELMRTHVDCAVLHAGESVFSFERLGLYPANTLRNVALALAPTDFALLLDVDFMTSHDASETMRNFQRERRAFKAPPNSGPTVYVVPAFEFVSAKEQLRDFTDDLAALAARQREMDALVRELPSSKRHVAELVRTNRMRPVHARKFAPAHNATNFPRWLAASPDDAPCSVEYERDFEPYILVRVADVPNFDERFVGYGFDKVIHAMTLAVEGATFAVLQTPFVVHVDHGVPRWRRAGGSMALRVQQTFFVATQELRERADGAESIARWMEG